MKTAGVKTLAQKSRLAGNMEVIIDTQLIDLYQSTKDKYNLTLHGGDAGLTNPVSWVYLAEDIQNMSFLKGGELIITTGLFKQSGTPLFDFISALATGNCSGIIINIGNYLDITDITPEVIQFCQVNHFPLFTMPWKIHLTDVMQEYCSILLSSVRSTDHLNAAFQTALYQTPVHENLLLTLSQYGFSPTADYQIIVAQNLTNISRITFSLNHLNIKYHLFEDKNWQVLIYLLSPVQSLLHEITESFLLCDGISLGISNVLHSISELSQGYKRARFALAAAIFWNLSSMHFNQLGIFQVLFSSSAPDILEDIYQEHLGKLEQFDNQHDTPYMETLRIFLLSDCSLIDTASRMHVHRNTIIYRLGKIKELLGTELDNSKIKFNLLMSFYIREYFSI